MSAVYEFDENFLKDAIIKGEELLKNPSISKKKKNYIKDSIKTFQRFVNDDYDLYPENIPSPKNIHSLKNQFLQNMRSCYNNLGHDAVTWMLELAETDIFSIPTGYEETELPMEEQVLLTLKNYQKISPSYYQIAKQIIENKKPSQIHEKTFLSDSSYVHEDSITTLPFLIIDPMDAPWIFNHEMQHAIESIKRYKTNLFYTELGSQFVEIPFLERLYEHQGYINTNDYASRVIDTQEHLESIKPYLEIMCLFANKDFQIPTDEFIETLSDQTSTSEEMLYYDLLYEYIETDINPTIYYTISYLKAIELHEQTKHLGIDIETVLKPYLKRRKFQYRKPKEGIKIYEKHLTSMEQLTK